MLVLGAVAADAHDLFLRPRDFVVRAGAEVRVRVLNGTFTTSESVVARERLRDLTVAGPAGVTHPDRAGWSDADKESEWRVSLQEPGTHVLGASLDPKTIRLTGTQFNKYLREEGLPEILAARKTGRRLGDPAHERYAKHVKALVRVQGDAPARSDTAWKRGVRLPGGARAARRSLHPRGGGHPAGARARRRRAAGEPGGAGGGRTTSGSRIAQREVRTDAEGIARIPLATRGTWYVKFIHMRPVPASARDSVNYESKWATLTFARP